MINRLDVLIYVIKKLKFVKGKKALQKIMYFVSECIPSSYVFRWWKYGPFSRELYDDMDLLEASGFLDYNPDKAEISAKNDLNSIEISLSKETMVRIDGLLDKLRSLSGDFDPRELELLASVHFLRNHAVGLRNKDDLDELYGALNLLKKSKFDRSEISDALEKTRRLEKFI